MKCFERRWLMVGMVAALMLGPASTLALWRCWTACNQRAEITGAVEFACLLDASRGTLCEAFKAYREAVEIRKRLTVPEPADRSPK
jgi:hypothetical protein